MESPTQGAPAVVAVVVAHDPGTWFDEALASLADQDYPNLSVLVIDAASTVDPTPRVAGALPDAFVRRIDRNDGFGAAANEALEVVEGAAFYLFLHDDVALAPSAVRVMVEEAFRSNAGVVGPKLVRWDDERRLLQVGESIDKSGTRAALVERYELDQEQHDSVRDVFVIPGGVTLIRADLFATIGGFDIAITFHNDDLALCWRAHLAGARVVVTPDALARHVEALGDRQPVEDRRELQNRHRVRTLLVCYSRFHLIRVVPQVLLIMVVEVLYALAVGRTRQARDLAGAWTWNLGQLSEIRAERREIAGFRSVPDSEIRNFQVRGSARFSAFVRGQIGQGDDDRLARATAAGRDLATSLNTGAIRFAVVAWAAIAVVMVVGSRHLITRSVPAVGEFGAFSDGAVDQLRVWLSGWRTIGLGSESPAPTALGASGVLGVVLLGSMGLLRQILILGLIPLGLIGVFRLTAPTGSLRSRVIGLIAYAAVPVPLQAISAGRWGALAAWAAAPFLVHQLALASGLAPWGPGLADDDDVEHALDPLRRRTLAAGVIAAIVALILPAVVIVLAVAAASIAAGNLLAGTVRGSGRILTAAAGAIGVTVVLHVPWSFDFVLPGARWASFVGADPGPAGLDVVDLLTFQTGDAVRSGLTAAVLLSASLALLIGRSWRFAWAVRSWALTLSAVAVAWVGEEGWLPVALPPADVFLALAGVGLALSTALGVLAFERDLRAYRFGWRQLASGVAAFALALSALPIIGATLSGRWSLPGGEHAQVLSFLETQSDEVPFRTLWLGNPTVLPLGSYELEPGLGYATTDRGLPGLSERFPSSDNGATGLIADAIELAGDRETSRLGRILAPMAIRYIVVVERQAPAPFEDDVRPVPASMRGLLAAQLDLEVIDVNPAVTVYENQASLPMRAQVPADFAAPDARFTDTVTVDASTAAPVLVDQTGYTSAEGELDAGVRVLQSVASSENWSLEVGGVKADRDKAFGFANGFTVESSGEAVLRYDTPVFRYGALLLQILLWLVALRTLLRYRVGPEAELR